MIVTEVVVLVAEVNRDKETVLDTKDMVHSTTLFEQVSAISGSSAVHKYLFDAEFFKVTWLLLCVVSSVYVQRPSELPVLSSTRSPPDTARNVPVPTFFNLTVVSCTKRIVQ